MNKNHEISSANISEKITTSRSTTIGASQWTPIFKLLALVVLADGKVRPESVKSFQDSLMELRAIIDPRLVMTRQMLLDWFKLNKDQLAALIYSLEYEETLLEIIGEMRGLPHKLDVVTCMVRIATSDGEYSKIEKLLIKKTILFWNIGDDLALPNSRMNSEEAIPRKGKVELPILVS